MDYDFKKVQAGAVSLAYVERGEGDPVVFVHGSGATDMRTWGAQIELFGERYRAIAYSRRYHYPNPWLGDGSEINDVAVHAADLAALIAALGLDRPHLVGLSFGADIALRFAVDYPRLVRSVALAEPGLFAWLVTLPGGADLFADFARAMMPAKEAAAAGDLESAARLWIDSFITSGAFEQLPASVHDRIMANARHIGFEPTALGELAGGVTRVEVAAIGAPALLLRGDESAPMFQRVIDDLERVLPRAERATIQQASHLLHVMNPTGFNAAVMEFWATHAH